MNLTNNERAYLQELRSLSTDSEGREVYIGLSHEESEEYRVLVQALDDHRSFQGRMEDHQRARDHYVKLDDKHEAARFQLLEVETFWPL
jgi:hypothetical protein